MFDNILEKKAHLRRETDALVGEFIAKRGENAITKCRPGKWTRRNAIFGRR